MKYVALAVLVFALAGCGGISINTADAVIGIHGSAVVGTSIGLQALSKDQASYDKVKAAATVARDSINAVVLPFLNGATIGQTTKDSLDLVVAQLDKNLDPTIKAAIQSAIDVALGLVPMPANPTDKLTADQRAMLVALFTGIADGINEFIAAGPPSVSVSKAKAAPVQKLHIGVVKK